MCKLCGYPGCCEAHPVFRTVVRDAPLFPVEEDVCGKALVEKGRRYMLRIEQNSVPLVKYFVKMSSKLDYLEFDTALQERSTLPKQAYLRVSIDDCLKLQRQWLHGKVHIRSCGILCFSSAKRQV